jgi:acetyl-CoA acyltransferase
VSAERIAARRGISRQATDHSLGSHHKAAQAHDAGLFDAELAPIAGGTRDETVHPDSTLETLARLWSEPA